MRRVALKIEYQGTSYHGWQKQSGVSSIQEAIEDALYEILRHPVDITCAGRTDLGVHAKGQVIHLDTPTDRDLRALTVGANVFLPPSIRIVGAREVQSDFHARYSATARRYEYWIYNRPIDAPLIQDRALWFKYPLSVEKMNQAVQYFLGEQDFQALRSSECQSLSSCREMYQARVTQRSPYWMCFEVEGNAFLHHMVRNMVGLLLQIGQGFRPPEWVLEVLASKDRRCAGVTAPPQGLYLMGVRYPEVFGLWSYDAEPALWM